MMGRLLLRVVVALVLVFLMLPLLSVIIASFSAGAPLVFPPTGFTSEPYFSIGQDFVSAAQNSLLIGALTALLATTIGTFTALALQRGVLPGRQVLATLCLSPLMVPTLVIGVSGYQFLLVVWDVVGLSFADTFLAIVLGHSAFTLPLVIRSVLAAHAHYDMRLEEAGANLGATPSQVFFRVTLPLLTPGIVAGSAFAFLMSFDDVPVALFLGGPSTVTLPVKIFTSIEFSFDASIMAVATVVVAISLMLMLLIDRFVGLAPVFGMERR